MRKLRGWVMPKEDAQNLIKLIGERLRSSRLDQRHYDVRVRLRKALVCNQGGADRTASPYHLGGNGSHKGGNDS